MAAKLGFGMVVQGATAANRKMMVARMEAQKTEPLWDKAIIIMEMSHTKTFRSQGRPRWTQSMRAKAQSGKTLQDTNKLLGSISAKTSDSIRDIKGKELHFGTKLPYGPYHQYGYPKRNNPKRQFLGVYPEDIKMMEKVFATDIENRIKVVSSG